MTLQCLDMYKPMRGGVIAKVPFALCPLPFGGRKLFEVCSNAASGHLIISQIKTKRLNAA